MGSRNRYFFSASYVLQIYQFILQNLFLILFFFLMMMILLLSQGHHIQIKRKLIVPSFLSHSSKSYNIVSLGSILCLLYSTNQKIRFHSQTFSFWLMSVLYLSEKRYYFKARFPSLPHPRAKGQNVFNDKCILLICMPEEIM